MNVQTAFLFTLVCLALTGGGGGKTSAAAKQGACVTLPSTEEEVLKLGTFWTLNPANSTLEVNLAAVLRFDACNRSDLETLQLVRVDLISTATSSGKISCQKLRKDSFVQASGVVNATSTSVTFDRVKGPFYIRLSHCSVTKSGSCKMIKGEDRRIFCVGDQNKSDAQVITRSVNISDVEDVCEFQIPTKVSADIVDSGKNITHPDVLYDVTHEQTCDINIRAVIPLCASRQSQDTVTLTLVNSELGDACTYEQFALKEKGDESSREKSIQIKLQACDVTDPESNVTTSMQCDEDSSHAALLDHHVKGLSRNLSYCLFFRLNNPHCQGQFGCVFYTEVISCGLIEGQRRHGHRMIVTEPVFIAGVSLTLVVFLTLLAWTVIQCSKKKPGTPLMTQTQIGMMKKPPRSLTEDDLEHISRLPSQEIVLVYFPDTKRFKDLNRKLRNWLITLDVNDVKDIYDEKATEEVLRNPEQWVRDALAGPEKRIILVCSRLAFECLTAIKRGVSSPRFVESDPHFGLLTRTVQYLDREMRGNYRNLICVRYEDLKICSRQYSSEAFNLVPGTEYVLPQHLEDIYRWIHPRQPDPDCWSDTKPEVRDLLETIRQYRHHDDNIFTVQFSATNTTCSDD